MKISFDRENENFGEKYIIKLYKYKTHVTLSSYKLDVSICIF